MKLITVGALNLIASVVRIATQLVVLKIVVLSVGAAGLVTVGQIQNLISLLGAGSTLGTFGGVVKLTADGENDRELVWSTALFISFVLAAVGAAMALLFSEALARFLFDDAGKAYLVVLCAAANGLVILQALIFHALTGLRHFKLFVTCSVLNSVLYLVLVAVAATLGGSTLILVIMCFSQAIQIVGAGVAFALMPEMNFRSMLRGLDRRVVAGLLPFVVIGLTTAGVFPATQVVVRSHLIATFGVAETGGWEAAMKISALYVSLLSTALGFYLLPTFSRAGADSKLQREVLRALVAVFCLLIVGAVLQLFLRNWIIVIVFSRELIVAADLLVLQLPGDVARVLTMVLLFLVTSKARSWAVVLINVAFGAAFYVATLVWTAMPEGTIAGASAAYTAGSFVAMAVALVSAGRLFVRRKG